MPQILVVEDDAEMVRGLKDNLEFEHFEVDVARDGEAALKKISGGAYDLIILDIMLPKLSGLDVCKRAREQGIATPIIMLTARSEEIDKVLGLELGADDYVTKPFSLRELAARVRALLRRVQIERGVPGGTYRDSRIEVDPSRHRVVCQGREVALTRRELDLLWHLISLSGRVASREQILDAVWGLAAEVDPRTVDAHIRTLRRKLGADVIETLFGSGYRFKAAE